MKTGLLTRMEDNGTRTVGRFTCDDNISLYTIERPWKNNQDGISCIPTGTYEVEAFDSPHFKRKVYRLVSVPGRTNVEIHPANHVEELKGCIALGEYITQANNTLINSTLALDKIMDYFGSDNWQLTIKSI